MPATVGDDVMRARFDGGESVMTADSSVSRKITHKTYDAYFQMLTQMVLA